MPNLSCKEAEAVVGAQADLLGLVPTDYDARPELSMAAASAIVAVHTRFENEFGSTRAAFLTGEAISRATTTSLEFLDME